ncbi:hypothetical protein AMATHDRAFT_66092 [Amanita thiersii Skay4041]|uniref:F-box domain-containing protein n=1 Tax=Amanita thiersii Skay4041 TaxID=703135 RepID=A0A2A9NIW8_9AGAR|nr:hypothetical protein AMATHDRAFT_66092 [Amanita thiersii Skay4041]
MDVFNPNILDACIRDVASLLTDNQKADLLLYAMRSIQPDRNSYTRTIIENAIQSCLQISTLNSENIAKARILRARARLAAGSYITAQDDLQAALIAEPDNPEAAALLYQRSVTVEKLLSPLPRSRERLSIEIWREIASYLPRRDLRSLLFVPHVISRVASQLLFKELDLYFCGIQSSDDDAECWSPTLPSNPSTEDIHHAHRSADILTRIITDVSFSGAVRTLRIHGPAHDKYGTLAFQTGMLTNALPKLINLHNVHISAGSESIVSILRVLQTSHPRLRGLSLRSSDGPVDLSYLEFRNLAHFSYCTNDGSPSVALNFIAQNKASLRTLSLLNDHWIFPSNALSIRHLTHINFLGYFPVNSHALVDILTHGRQLEALTLSCRLDSSTSSQFFRSMPKALPFLRHFGFTVHGVCKRIRDTDLFPAIAEFLRGRLQLRTLTLIVTYESDQQSTGFSAAIWGVLPSLVNLTTLKITYPSDLAPGLAAWLIPRSIKALNLTLEHGGTSSALRDPIPFLDHLRPGVPSELRYIGLSQFPIRNVALIVEHGFPMVRVVGVANNYWTVKKHKKDVTTASHEGVLLEMEQWPRRRVAYHAAEWLEWLGCEDAVAGVQDVIFPA